jgi:choice-of-anchor A domain-containing protein
VAINLTDLVLGAGQVLLLNGNAGTRYIINVSNRMALTGGTVQVGAGLPPENVLVNLGTAGTAVTLGSNARFTGTLLAPYRAITVNTGAQVTGGTIGSSINVFSGGKLRRGP